MSQIETKACKKCGLEKPLEQFYACKTNKDGKMGSCISCRSKAFKAYMQTSEAKKMAVDTIRRYRARNPEKAKERNRKSNAKRKENYPNGHKEYRKNNPDKISAYVRKYQQKHIQTISDRYLTKVLGVPEDCIELSRAKIQILRATKQLVETIKEKQK